MPFGRYPEEVKAFRRWAADRVDKATINDRATGASSHGGKLTTTKRRRWRVKRHRRSRRRRKGE